MRQIGWSFRRRFTDAATLYQARSKNSYDDIVGLVNTAGVVTALVVAFVLGVQYMMDSESLFKMDFKCLICAQEGFRSFAISTMKTFDTGLYKEGRMATYIPLAAGGEDMFNVTSVILVDIPKNWPDAQGAQNILDLQNCFTDVEVQIATELLFADFPKQLMTAWALRHPQAYRFSSRTAKWGFVSSSLCLCALLWSICLYISLSSGPAGEDPTGSSLNAWNWVGLPTLAVTYGMLLTGLVIFLMAHAGVLSARSSFLEDSWNHVQAWQWATIAGIVLAVVLGLVANILSWIKSQAKSNRDVSTPEEPPV